MDRVHKGTELWERDQSTISQVGNEFDSFVDSNLVLLDERETSLNLWLEEVHKDALILTFHGSGLIFCLFQ